MNKIKFLFLALSLSLSLSLILVHLFKLLYNVKFTVNDFFYYVTLYIKVSRQRLIFGVFVASEFDRQTTVLHVLYRYRIASIFDEKEFW